MGGTIYPLANLKGSVGRLREERRKRGNQGDKLDYACYDGRKKDKNENN